MGEVGLHTLTEVARCLAFYETAPRATAKDVVQDVALRNPPERRFDETMRALARATEWTLSERQACDTINATVSRLVQRLDTELATLRDIERDVVLCRCDETTCGCESAAEHSRCESAWHRPRDAPRGSAQRHEAASRCSGAPAEVETLLSRHCPMRLDGLSFDAEDRVVQRGVFMLKEWTGKHTPTRLFDSRVDAFTNEVLFQRVYSRPNVAVIGFTADGDVFGGFNSRTVSQSDFLYDPSVFIFSLESHGRCRTPQRFAVRNGLRDKAGVWFDQKNANGWFVQFWVFGCGGFSLGNERSQTSCAALSSAFEGIEDTTLTGKSGEAHRCTRLVAIQFG